MEERDRLAKDLSQAGLTLEEIGRRVGLSGARVGQILARRRRQDIEDAVAARTLAEIRSVDDPGRKYDINALLSAFHLSSRLRKALAMRLPDKVGFADLAALVADKSSSGDHIVPPLLMMRNLGRKSFRVFCKNISASGLGKACVEEWRNRLRLFVEHVPRATEILPGYAELLEEPKAV